MVEALQVHHALGLTPGVVGLETLQPTVEALGRDLDDPLRHSRLSLGKGSIDLLLPGDEGLLYGEAVVRRHRQLATAMGLEAKLIG